MRPILDQHLDVHIFKSHYWLKNELRHFCKQHGLQQSGAKLELQSRIEAFLARKKIVPSQKKTTRPKATRDLVPLTLETIITENHRCTSAVRQFFQSHTDQKFHFSLFIQKYFKQNIGKTYRDVLSAWYDEAERNRLHPVQTSISPQFKYNQFIRDYFQDPNNKSASLQEAIAAWHIVKKTPGQHKYSPNK